MSATVSPLAEAEQRILAAMHLHEPQRVCIAHHYDHDCPDGRGYLWRCFTCARTQAVACRTWRTLSGMDKPA